MTPVLPLCSMTGADMDTEERATDRVTPEQARAHLVTPEEGTGDKWSGDEWSPDVAGVQSTKCVSAHRA
eukprot:scaffold225084_cov26-Tisochrysis_lutea.AAC.1